MIDDYTHREVGVLYVVENIPGPADSSAEYSDLMNNFNSQLAEYCSCRGINCTVDTCKCLQLSGGYNYTLSSDLETACLVINRKSNEACPIIECNDNCCCSVNCHNRLVQKGPICNLFVKCCYIQSKGLGLFTNDHITKGSYICEYAGELITKTQTVMRQNANMLLGKMNYIFCLNEHSNSGIFQTFVDPSSIGNIGRYINHSCEPNAHILPVRFNTPIPKLAIFASVDILPGEEITFNYGDHSVGPLEFASTSDRKKCLCNSYSCNGFMPYNAY